MPRAGMGRGRHGGGHSHGNHGHHGGSFRGHGRGGHSHGNHGHHGGGFRGHGGGGVMHHHHHPRDMHHPPRHHHHCNLHCQPPRGRRFHLEEFDRCDLERLLHILYDIRDRRRLSCYDEEFLYCCFPHGVVYHEVSDFIFWLEDELRYI